MSIEKREMATEEVLKYVRGLENAAEQRYAETYLIWFRLRFGPLPSTGVTTYGYEEPITPVDLTHEAGQRIRRSLTGIFAKHSESAG